MATADVKRMHESNGLPVRVIGHGNRTMWSEVFERNPRITRDVNRKHQTLVNGPGLRPYIAGKTATHWFWRRQRNQQPGEIYLSAQEKQFAKQFVGKVLIEPNVKATNGHTNKAWPFERWQAVVNELKVPMVQVGFPGTRWLQDVERVETPTFRHAAAVLSACKAFVGSEGALHHAAAALGVPAVVLYAEFISPDVSGYASQENIRHAGEPCGSRIPCKTCAASMLAIPVEEVTDKLGRVVL